MSSTLIAPILDCSVLRGKELLETRLCWIEEHVGSTPTSPNGTCGVMVCMGYCGYLGEGSIPFRYPVIDGSYGEVVSRLLVAQKLRVRFPVSYPCFN